MEMAAPRLSSKLDKFNNPIVQQWVESFLPYGKRRLTSGMKQQLPSEPMSTSNCSPKSIQLGIVYSCQQVLYGGRSSRSLDFKYYRPYLIIEQMGKEASKLMLGDVGC
jgi:hypothetical protein